MTTLTLFIVIALLMTIGAGALLVWPLLRSDDDKAPVAAGGVVAALPVLVLALYLSFSNWPWQGAPAPAAAAGEAAPSIEEMVGGLERRLQSQPDDLEGWQMLGRSYVVLGRFQDALQAYGRARELSGDTDVVALTGYAEALAMQQGGVIGEQAASLFERALTLAPDDRKGLWYGGVAAYERGDNALARARWSRLLSLDPPEAMARILRDQIAVLDDMSSATGAPVAASAGLGVEVVLDASLADRAPPDAALFILARPPGGGGPPLAVVRRQVADLPLRLTLSDADAMMPGRTLSSQGEVEVVARISLGGGPTAQPGDPFGISVSPSDGQVVVSIDQIYGP